MSAIKCRDAFEVLCRMTIFGALPGGKSIHDPILEDSNGLMDYVEEALSDEQFWDSSPQTKKGLSKLELKKILIRLTEESK